MGFIEAIIPTILAMIIFWIGMRAVVQADRRERAAQARIEAEQRLAEQEQQRVAEGDGSVPATPVAANRSGQPAQAGADVDR